MALNYDNINAREKECHPKDLKMKIIYFSHFHSQNAYSGFYLLTNWERWLFIHIIIIVENSNYVESNLTEFCRWPFVWDRFTTYLESFKMFEYFFILISLIFKLMLNFWRRITCFSSIYCIWYSAYCTYLLIQSIIRNFFFIRKSIWEYFELEPRSNLLLMLRQLFWF